MPFFGRHHGHGHAGMPVRAQAAMAMKRGGPAMGTMGPTDGAAGLPPAAAAQKMGGPAAKPKMTMDNSSPSL
jgi:hypothetical protein